MKTKGLHRESIKYIVTFAMLLNHIANVFMDLNSVSGRLMVGLGYSTAITMCFFLEEGYRYTRSKKAYVIRLAACAILSQLPYMLAFAEAGQILSWKNMNMMFSLLVCFLFLMVTDRMEPGLFKTAMVLILVALSMCSDWNVISLVYIFAFHWAGENQEKRILAFTGSILFVVLNFILINMETMALPRAIFFTGLETTGLLLSAIMILCFYNGKKAERGGTFHKWFFYLFYPLHLLLLGGIRLAIM